MKRLRQKSIHLCHQALLHLCRMCNQLCSIAVTEEFLLQTSLRPEGQRRCQIVCLSVSVYVGLLAKALEGVGMENAPSVIQGPN